ncbi:MAG TPA: LptF/LptG family permease, partial [Opitutales bacterium]|nr:LptF/LptG family permease [Opitutales bacterium]
IFIEWIKVFVLALLVTVGILLLEDIYDNLPDLLQTNASISSIVIYYAGLIPSFLPAILPLGLLLSLLFSLGNLHRHNEITAMRAAGLSLWRITRSLWVSALGLSVALLYLNSSLVPLSVERSRNFIKQIELNQALSTEDGYNSAILRAFTFTHPREHRFWIFNAFNELSYRGFGVSVYQADSNNRETTRIIAQECYYDDVEHQWVFMHGREIQFNPLNQEPIRSVSFESLSFPQWSETPELMHALGQDPEVLSLREIQSLLDEVPLATNPRMRSYAVRESFILASPWICLILVGLAIPFAISGVRVNPVVGLSKCVGLFFFYYLIVHITSLLGEQGVIAPLWAAWSPNILLIAIALYLYPKAR